MMNLNKVLLIGRLTRDPELRYTPQGIPVSDIGLAVNREFGGGSGGERRRETTFVDVTLWRRDAELVCQFLKKGSPIYIEGRLALDTWETQEGQRRSRLRVVADRFQFVSTRGETARDGAEPAGGDPAYTSNYEPRGSSSPPASPPAKGAGEPARSWDPEGEGAGQNESFDESEVPF